MNVSIISSVCMAVLLAALPVLAQEKGNVDWQHGYIFAVGQGTASAQEHRGKAKIKATTAAKVAAQRNLLEVIKGVRITSVSTVQDAMLVGDVIRTRIDGMLKGAFIEGDPQIEYVDGAPVVTVLMKVCLNGGPKECASRPNLTNVLNLDTRPLPPAAPVILLTAPTPPPLPPASPAPVQDTGWKPPVYDPTRPVTGLVVNLNGRYFERELLPVVITQGQPDLVTVYCVKTVKPAVVRTYGAVRYAESLEHARRIQAVGSNPIIVTADGISRENMIVIRSGDAKLLRETLAHGNDYLAEAKVVISNR